MDDRHERFAQEYLRDLAPGAAYSRVYPKATREAACVGGWRLLRDPAVAARVQELKQERNQRMGLEHDRVLRQLLDVVESDIRRVFTDAGRLRHPTEIDDRTLNAIAAIRVRVVRSKNGTTEEMVDVRLWDKVAAIRLAMAHMGMLIERHEVAAQVVVHEVTNTDRPSERLLELMERGRQRKAAQSSAPPRVSSPAHALGAQDAAKLELLASPRRRRRSGSR